MGKKSTSRKSKGTGNSMKSKFQSFFKRTIKTGAQVVKGTGGYKSNIRKRKRMYDEAGDISPKKKKK